MLLRKIQSIVSLIIFLLMAQSLYSQEDLQVAPSVIINEININDISNDDVYFELIVSGSSQNPCDLQVPEADLVIDDNNEGNNFKPGYLAIDATCIQDAKKGDKIIVYGKNTDIGSNYARYKFRIDDSCIKKWSHQPNQNNPNYFGFLVLDNTAKIGDFINLENPGEKVNVRTRQNEIQNLTQALNQTNYSLTSGDFGEYLQNIPSPSASNNDLNNILLTSIENTPELYVESEVFSANNKGQNIKNDIKITICGGVGPYRLIDEEGRDSYSVDPEFTVVDARCGSHLLSVIDNNGLQSSTTADVEVQQNIYLDVCEDALISFDLIECINIDDPCYAWFPEDLFENLPDGNKTEAPEIYLDSNIPNQIITLKISNREGYLTNTYYYHITIHADEDGDGFCGSNDPDDNNPCDPVNSLTIEISGDDNMCSGENKTLSCTSGDSYLWSTGETTNSITTSEGGVYNVTVSNNNGCSGTATHFLAEFDSPEASLDPTIELCLQNGTLIADAWMIVDGSDDYLYTWNTGHVGRSINLTQQNLGSGIYTVTVTSGICSVVLETEVVENTGNCCENDPLLMDYTGSLEICPGGSTVLSVTISGGSPPYSLIAPSDAEITEVGLGLYEVEVWNADALFFMGADDAYSCGNDNPDETRVILDIIVTENTDDLDNDGICDGLDEDPEDPCIPYMDSDQDGVCDGLDCAPEDGFIAPGLSCDDLDPCTNNDVYNADCECIGVLIPHCDCDNPGSPCDDGIFCTTNDIIQENCQCEGEIIPACEECETGTPCDDGDACTIDDQVVFGCECLGTLIESGQSCDDADQCTIDDMYNDNCECVGTSIVVGQECDDDDPCTPISSYQIINGECTCAGESELSFEIIQNPVGDCNILYGSLNSDSQFMEYRWKVNGRVVSEQDTCTITEFGTYSLQVKNANGCELEKEVEIFDYSDPSIEIEASADIICNSSNPVQLSVDGIWENRSWHDSQGNNLGSNYEIDIYNRGLYKFEGTDSNGCQRHGEIFINQTFQPLIKIEQRESELCMEESFTLFIEPLEFDAEVVWDGPGIVNYISDFEILVNIPGEYSVNVKSLAPESLNCEATDFHTIIDPGNPIDIGQLLLDQGFEVQDIDVNIVTAVPPSSLSYKSLNNCGNFEDLCGAVYEDITLMNGTTVDKLNGSSDALLNAFICDNNVCGISYGGVLVNSLCGEDGMDLEVFLGKEDDYDHSFLFYIDYDEDGEDSKLYSKVNRCSAYSQESETFEAALFEILCGLKEYNANPDEVSPYLTLTQNPALPHFTSGRTTLFDGNTYNGILANDLIISPFDGPALPITTDQGFFVQNYLAGWEIDLTELIWDDGSPGSFKSCASKLELANSASLTFNYNDCENQLTIHLDPDELTAFKEVILNPESFVQKGLDVNDLIHNDFMENFPPCLDIYHCEILNAEIPPYGASPTSNRSAERVNHLLKYLPRNMYDSIITCIEENELVNRYHQSSLENERDFLKSTLSIYLKSSRYDAPGEVNNDVIFDGERYAFLAGSFYHNKFHPNKVSTRHDRYNYLIDYEYVGDAEFDYFKNYIIRVGNKFNFLGSGNKLPAQEDNEKAELFSIKVPGIYVPYATAKWDEKQFDEDIELTVQGLSVIASFFGFPGGVVATRWAAFVRAMAIADIANETSKLFLMENFCECTLPDSAEFCAKWREITKYADYALLGGGLIDGGKTILDLRKAFSELDDDAKAVLNKAVSEELRDDDLAKQFKTVYAGVDAYLDLFKKRYPDFWQNNQGLFTGPDGPFHKLSTWANNGEIRISGLLDPNVASKIDNTLIGQDFIQKVVGTHSLTKPDALVRSLHKLTPDVYETWKHLNSTAKNLTRNMAFLDEITKLRLNKQLNAVLATKFAGPAEPWEELLKKLKNKEKDNGYTWGCSTCGGYKPWIEIVLKDLNEFYNLYNGAKNFEKVIHALGSGWKKAKGANWVMNLSVSKKFNNAEFEVHTGGNGRKIVDIFADNQYFECKSWSKNRLASGNFKSQFKDYFTNTMLNIDKIGFYFHPNTSHYARWSRPEIKPSDLENALIAISNADPNYFDLMTLSDQYKKFFNFSSGDMMDILLDERKLIKKIVEKHFDKIIRNTN